MGAGAAAGAITAVLTAERMLAALSVTTTKTVENLCFFKMTAKIMRFLYKVWAVAVTGAIAAVPRATKISVALSVVIEGTCEFFCFIW